MFSWNPCGYNLCFLTTTDNVCALALASIWSCFLTIPHHEGVSICLTPLTRGMTLTIPLPYVTTTSLAIILSLGGWSLSFPFRMTRGWSLDPSHESRESDSLVMIKLFQGGLYYPWPPLGRGFALHLSLLFLPLVEWSESPSVILECQFWVNLTGFKSSLHTAPIFYVDFSEQAPRRCHTCTMYATGVPCTPSSHSLIRSYA